jgi:hypothetical protein
MYPALITTVRLLGFRRLLVVEFIQASSQAGFTPEGIDGLLRDKTRKPGKTAAAGPTSCTAGRRRRDQCGVFTFLADPKAAKKPTPMKTLHVGRRPQTRPGRCQTEKQALEAWPLDSLERQGDPLPYPNAHRRETQLAPPCLQRVRRGEREARP